MRCVAVVLLLLTAACAAEAPAPDREAATAAYADLRERARADLQSWQSSGAVADPRPKWAEELMAFAVTWPETPQSVEAIIASMDLYAESREVQGFFRAWELALVHCADEPAFRYTFEKLVLMRMVEAGGLSILISLDDKARERAWRTAAPRIVEDLRRAIDATKLDETRAAAHYTLGRTWYELGLNRGKALGELSEALVQLVAEVKQTGKSGELTYTIKIEPLDNDAEQVQLKDEIKLKHPKQKRKETVMFTTEDNRLTRKPNTPELPGLQIVSDDRPAAERHAPPAAAAR